MDNQQSMQPQNPQTGNFLKKFLSWKIILVLAGVFLIAELAWAFNFLTKPIPEPPQAPKKVIPMATLSLETAKKDLKVGETTDVNITLSTGGRKTDGTDVILTFDPNILEVVPATSSGSVKPPVKVGKVYSDYPLNSLESPGRIVLSGITGFSESFSGTGVVGTITFKAKKIGTTEIKIEKEAGSTTDSNVVESVSTRDILINVRNLTLNVN